MIEISRYGRNVEFTNVTVEAVAEANRVIVEGIQRLQKEDAMFKIYQKDKAGNPIGQPWEPRYASFYEAQAEIVKQTQVVADALPADRFIVVEESDDPPLEIAGEPFFQQVKNAVGIGGKTDMLPASIPVEVYDPKTKTFADGGTLADYLKPPSRQRMLEGAHLIYRRDPTKERTDLADVVGDPLGKPCETMSEAEALRIVLAAQMNIEPWGLVIVVAEGAVPVED